MKNICCMRRYEIIENTGRLEVRTYSCKEVKELKEIWKMQFRRKNGSDYVKVDRAYDDFVKEIEDFLSKCKCEYKE